MKYAYHRNKIFVEWQLIFLFPSKILREFFLIFCNVTQEEINRYIHEIESRRADKYRTEKSIRKYFPELSVYIDSIAAPPDAKGIPMKFRQKLWHISHNDETFMLGRCTCGKRTTFIDGKYKRFCSTQCGLRSDDVRSHLSEVCSSEEVLNKMKMTCRNKYGSDYALQNNDIKNKIKQTNISRYGCENSGASDIVKNKRMHTLIKRYGVSNVFVAESIIQKIKMTNIKKYNTAYPIQNESVKRKAIDTTIERYGVANPMMLDMFKQKTIDTNISRYGVQHAMQNAEILQKAIMTNISRYGTAWAFQNDDVKNKIKESNIRKYGVEYPAQNDKIRQKTEETNIHRYGCPNPMSNIDIQEKLAATMLAKFGVEHISTHPDIRYALSKALSSPEVQQKINDTKRKNNSFNTSSIENKVAEYLTNNDIKFIRQYKSKEYPFNCDFYLIDYQLYIEINASWTHGKRPYVETDIECMERLKLWTKKAESSKYYRNAIEVWTVRDVRKRETAKTNGLNYLEVFSNDIEEIVTYIDNAIHI